MKISDKVAEGAKLLDRVRPSWPRDFDRHKLDMRHTRFELLAQIFGTHLAGMQALGLKLSDGARYGFDLAGTVWHGSPQWQELRDAWLHEATKRLAA